LGLARAQATYERMRAGWIWRRACPLLHETKIAEWRTRGFDRHFDPRCRSV